MADIHLHNFTLLDVQAQKKAIRLLPDL